MCDVLIRLSEGQNLFYVSVCISSAMDLILVSV